MYSHASTVVTLALLLAVPAAAQPGRPIVATDRGAVRGAIEGGVTSWKGIPFAAPPLGALRWRAPQPAPAWAGVREATAYSHDCMQKPFPSDAAPLGTEPAEDCLYLNVWKPAASKPGKLPVVVWIYGGGFVNGGASPPTYSGANMARKGVVFVSFNYRVGRFGTFAFPALTKADPDAGRLGNYGVMDQIAALQWVQRNVAAFGGDPANVTIVGESAGGMSVHMLVTSPLARGLFSKAFAMSGGNGRSQASTLAQVEQIGVNFARAKGIDPAAPDALARLRGLSAEQVIDGLNLSQLFRRDRVATFSGPFADGKVVVDVGAAYAAGRFHKGPMLIGATSADIGGQRGYMIAGARDVAGVVAKQGVPVWTYRFSYVASSVRQPGAQHASDIPFFLDTAAIKYGETTTPRDRGLSKLASDYVVNFAKRGDPNGPGLPVWPRYARSSDILMDFTAMGTAIAGRDPWGPAIDAAETRLDAARASPHYTTLTTPIGVLLDDPVARAVLAQQVPGLVDSPQIEMARGLTLDALHAYLPTLTDAKLRAIDADLAKLPANTKYHQDE